MALPTNIELMFGESPESAKLSKAEVSVRFDELVKSIQGVPERELTREEIVTSFKAGQPIDFSPRPTNAYEYMTKALRSPELAKSMSPDAVASVAQALEALKGQQPDLVKDISLTSPVGTGLVAFDLEDPSKFLAPRPTPVSNRMPRIKGFGTSHRFKVISGITGSGTGGVGNTHPGIADSTQTNFAPSGASNSLYYARGPKIAYAGYDVVLPHSQFSMSDEVTWSAQYAGQGYQDIRQLSRTSLLYASKLMEERMLLMGRGTASGYAGALAAPTGTSLVDNTTAGTQVALTGYTTNIYVYVTADAGAFGESVVSTVATIAPTAGHNVVLRLTDVPAALGYKVYIGTGAAQPANSAFFLYGRFPNQAVNAGGAGGAGIVLQGAIPVAGANPPTADTSAYSAGYDGILAWCMGASSGYNVKINSKFGTATPGSEFQDAFASLYNSVKAEPDRIMFNGADRKQLSATLKTGEANNYFLQVTQDQVSGVTLGSVAVAIMNETVGKRTEMEVSPWLPQGVCPIVSDTLPIPDSQVSNVWSICNVQDFMGIDWPVTQFAYESSSYWFGTFLCFAPGWNGCVSGVTAG